ncbi:hypothetical protein [Sphingomonas sp. Leaf339]|uniref:hypothetical protein n=1 Tax=Sphingomonas sp. Leaf339 TaxID=1736343 RepID=UPI000AC6BF51|nr:hypothetical protein [Sphingomonas sp. Leaf339]
MAAVPGSGCGDGASREYENSYELLRQCFPKRTELRVDRIEFPAAVAAILNG